MKIKINKDISWMSRVWIFLYFNIQKMVRRPSWRSALANLEALTRPSKTRSLDSEKSKAMFKALSENGHTSDINPLSKEQVKEMYDYLVKQKMLEYRSSDNRAFTLDEVPTNWSTAYYPIETLIKAPHLFTVANNPDILSVIENRFGCKPEIGVMQAMWRFPNDNDPVDDELWHRDYEALRFVKCFLYLTDVDSNSGPHKFIETSHRVNKKTKIGSIRTDEEIEKSYDKERIVTKVGPAGTCFLEETNGWHKGTKPIDRPRLMIQIVYSIYPVKYKDRKPVARDEIPGHENTQFDQHIFKNHVLP